MSSRSSTPSCGRGTYTASRLHHAFPEPLPLSLLTALEPLSFFHHLICLYIYFFFLIGAQPHQSVKFRGQELVFKGKALTMTWEGSEMVTS